MKKKILIVIVLYNCKLNESKSFLSLAPPLENLIVFDNSESPQDISVYAGKAVYIHNGTNIGLSACYNKAAKYAKDNGYQWLLLLDQDTDFSGVSLADYLNAIKNYKDCNIIAPLVKCGKYTMSPAVLKLKIPHVSLTEFRGVVSLEKISLINSGMCVSIRSFWNCGGYNEKVFLDFSDHEFLRRYKKYNSVAYILPQLIKQDFSVVTDDKMKSLARFKMFCRSLRGCEKETIEDCIVFSLIILKRTIRLIVETHDFKVVQIVFNNYFRKNEKNISLHC